MVILLPLVMDSGGVIYEPGNDSKRRKRPSKGDSSTANKAHSSLKEVAIMAKKSHVKTLILTHFSVGVVNEKETLKEMS